jgi:DNA-directed RNA polymerase subunit RPC12/RpoP
MPSGKRYKQTGESLMVIKLNRNEAAQLKRGEKPQGVSKTTFRFYKKFGTINCLFCKALFIKHREDQYYCCHKCKVYHYRGAGYVDSSNLMAKCRECKKPYDRGHIRGPIYCFDCDSKKSRHNAYYWTMQRKLKGPNLFD